MCYLQLLITQRQQQYLTFSRRPGEMKTTTLHLLLLFLFLLPQQVVSQFDKPAFRHYVADDGLPSREVYEVLQDRRGYLWFGTDHGVSRFNGYEFENFGVQQGLRDNVIFYLHEDIHGRIWMVSMSERLYYYDYTRDSIFSYEYNGRIQPYVKKQNGPLGFYVDSTGTVYRSLDQQGVLKIDPDGQESLIPGTPWESHLIAMVAGRYFQSKKHYDNSSWHIRKQMPILYYNDRGLRQLNVANNWIEGSQGGTGYLLALQDDKLLAYINKFFYLFQNGEISWMRADPKFEVISAFLDQQGKLYLGGRDQGVRIYENENSLKDNTYTQLLPGYSVSHILQDRQGGFWFTTTEDGVFYAPSLAFNVKDRSSGLPENNIVSLEVHNQDSIWVATRNGAVALVDRANRLVQALARPWSGEVFTLKKGPEGLLWLLTSLGIYRLDGNDKIRHLPIRTKPEKYFKEIIFSRENPGNFFLISPSGFFEYNSAQQQLGFNSKSVGFNKRIGSFLEDQNGNWWIGTTNGLYTMEDGDTIIPVSRHQNMSLRIEALAELDDGTLVIGTKGAGLLLWKDEFIQEIGVEQGLVSAMVENLHVDTAQNIWVATFEGISKVRPDGQVENFTISDGLPSNEVSDIDSYGSRVWAATRGGLFEISRKPSTSPPITMLEEIQVNGQAERAENVRRLPYAKNNLQLNFLAIDYTQDGQIRYRYRLESNAPWNYTTNRTVNYATLSEGDYQFEVQARNKDGEWGISTFLPFSIRPPFWRTLWFAGLMILAIGGLAFLFYRNRLNLYRQELAIKELTLQKEQEQLVREKEINQLQAAALRAQMNPHFIFNCLNSIQSFIVTGEKIEASRYLSRFATLVRGVLKASQQERISLEEETAMLENYLVLEQMRFDGHFTFQIEVTDELGLSETTLPPMLVQPFVENAILHGLKDNSKEGRIDICYQQVNGQLRVTVTDNGIGITAANQRKQRDGSTHQSMGTSLTQKRLTLLTQANEQGTVEISDRKDENGIVQGTQVVIYIATKVG